VAVVLTLVQPKQIRINIHKRNNKNTVQTIQNTINTSTRITKTTTQLSKHHHMHSPTHYKRSQNKHSTRYTTNEIVTIKSCTLSIRAP